MSKLNRRDLLGLLPLRQAFTTWRLVTIFLSAAVPLITVLATVASATELIPMTFGATVRKAKLGFAGTVDGLSYRRADGFVVTDVHFSNVKYSHGNRPGTTLVLTVQGGRMDGKLYMVDGLPSFNSGERYIVLAGDQGSARNWYLPIIGFTQGFFSAKAERPGGSPVVHDADGRPIIGLHGKHLAVLSRSRGETKTSRKPEIVREYGLGERGLDRVEPATEVYPPETDPGSRVSEEEFLRAIQQLKASEK